MVHPATVLASKASGCDVDAKHYGLSLFVNAWNTNSGQLFLSWGNAKSGCEELATAPRMVAPGKWAFVAATIDEAGEAALYVNGELRAHSAKMPRIGEQRISSSASPIDMPKSCARPPGPRSVKITLAGASSG